MMKTMMNKVAENKGKIMNEMIALVDKQALTNYILKTDSKFLEMGITNLQGMDTLLRDWARAKAHMYVKFGNQLKISKSVECATSPKVVQQALTDFKQEFTAPQYRLALAFLSILDNSEIVSNILVKDYIIFDTKFTKGMRVSRCFKKLIPSKLISDFQTKYSMVIQKFTVQGKAVISIDPMDYLTMSVNNSGWSSCHSIGGGLHKGGCLSYMIDPSTAISYTTDKMLTANRKHEGLSYANKLWRQCVHIGDRYAIQARQYPGLNESNRNSVAQLLLDMYTNITGKEYSNTLMSSYDLGEYQWEDEDGLAYNDIYHESFDNGGSIIQPTEDLVNNIMYDSEEVIQINTSVTCLHCGEDAIEDTSRLYCDYCFRSDDYEDEEWYDEDDDDDIF